MLVVGEAHIGGHFGESGEFRGAESAFTGDELIGFIVEAANGERLDDAVYADAGRQFFECGFVKFLTGLAAVHFDLIEWDHGEVGGEFAYYFYRIFLYGLFQLCRVGEQGANAFAEVLLICFFSHC